MNEMTAEEIKAARAGVTFDGEAIRLGNVIYIIPSLSVKQSKKLWPTIMALDKEGVGSVELLQKQDMCVDIIHAAMTRNYPNLSRDQLDELIDVRNLRQLMRMVSSRSGLKDAQPGESQPEAETRPVVH